MFDEFDTVTEAFTFLTSQLKLLLAKTDFSDIRRSCIEQINTPGGAQLPPELIAKVKSCKNVDMLFEVLAESVYWSWIDIRLMKVMAVASCSLKAINLIESYRKVVFTKNLKGVLPDTLSTKLALILNKDPNDMTVEDLLEHQSLLESMIMDKLKGMHITDNLSIPEDQLRKGIAIATYNIYVLMC